MYDNVYQYYPLIITGIITTIAGIIILILGLVCLANRSTEPHNADPGKNQEPVDGTDKNWAMGIHLSAFSGYIIPFGGLIGPLVIWLTKRNQHPFIDQHGKEAVNFRISLFIYFIAAFLLCFVLIGFLLIFALWLMDIILTIIAAVRASDGEEYHYPLSIRFIK